MRYYAKISFLDFEEFGLLDSGANVSCIGAELATTDFSNYPNFLKCQSQVKTADGAIQKVLGWVDVTVSFKGKSSRLRLFVIPSIKQRLILGTDFLRAFGLFPDVLGSVDLIVSGKMYDKLHDLSAVNGNCKIGNQLEIGRAHV